MKLNITTRATEVTERYNEPVQRNETEFSFKESEDKSVITFEVGYSKYELDKAKVEEMIEIFSMLKERMVTPIVLDGYEETESQCGSLS